MQVRQRGTRRQRVRQAAHYRHTAGYERYNTSRCCPVRILPLNSLFFGTPSLLVRLALLFAPALLIGFSLLLFCLATFFFSLPSLLLYPPCFFVRLTLLLTLALRFARSLPVESVPK